MNITIKFNFSKVKFEVFWQIDNDNGRSGNVKIPRDITKSFIFWTESSVSPHESIVQSIQTNGGLCLTHRKIHSGRALRIMGDFTIKGGAQVCNAFIFPITRKWILPPHIADIGKKIWLVQYYNPGFSWRLNNSNNTRSIDILSTVTYVILHFGDYKKKTYFQALP